MYIPEGFIKEIPSGDIAKSTDALSFFLYCKGIVSNSVIYDYCINEKKCISRYASLFGVDRRTLRKKIELLKELNLVKKSGNHLILVCLEREFVYTTDAFGRRDKKWKGKYFRIKTNKKFSLKQYRSIVRGLVIKTVFKKFYLRAVNSEKSQKEDQISVKEQVRRLRLANDFRSRRNVNGKNPEIRMGIKFIAKQIKCSKSTADRVINDLVKIRIVKKTTGNIRSEFLECMNVSLDKIAERVCSGRGSFLHKGKYYEKQCNAYLF